MLLAHHGQRSHNRHRLDGGQTDPSGCREDAADHQRRLAGNTSPMNAADSPNASTPTITWTATAGTDITAFTAG